MQVANMHEAIKVICLCALLSVGIDPRIVNLGSRSKWAISFTPRPLYPPVLIG